MANSIQPVILLGGSGTRLWPLSRQSRPKQFLPLMGSESLFQQTLLRLDHENALTGLEILPPIIVAGESHKNMVREQLAEIGQNAARLILEPFGRNTAPALTSAALLAAEIAPDSLLLCLPADHYIQKPGEFLRLVSAGSVGARAGKLITFGIVADRPETGYGYIRKGAASGIGAELFSVQQFVEKPNAQRAKEFLETGEYLWNSGMFLMDSQVLLEEMQRFSPQTVSAVRAAMDKGKSVGQDLFLEGASFGQADNDSIDCAVMEKTSHACVVPADIGWSDVGSFEALWALAAKDRGENALSGEVVAVETSGSFVNARSKLIVTFGVEDLVVIDTEDALLITTRQRASDMKTVLSELQKNNRSEVK